MEYYFAPMEGITTWYFRNLHHEFFPGMDRYYTPFLSANQNFTFQSREQADVDPENNKGIVVVPQLMTNKADEFLWGARKLSGLGYEEINLNLGCPASQVVNRKKGAGFLENPAALDRFFEETFDGMAKMQDSFRVSVKTRIGYHTESEAGELLKIYNRYPISMIIIHPRTLREYYRGTPHQDVFGRMLEESRHPVCYNGDINTVEDYEALLRSFPVDRYPQWKAVMFGRGLIRDPALVRRIQGGNPLSDAECRKFTSTLLQIYAENIDGGDKNVLNKMKEIWTHLGTGFDGKDGRAMTAERALREIHKSKTLREYKIAVESFYAACERRKN